ncbi:MAG: hypothetical protein P9M14_00960, partial [Candidatus Alcyoniella australis]|nr:hypothetical protein [Candidatus Alcyoniella australis]
GTQLGLLTALNGLAPGRVHSVAALGQRLFVASDSGLSILEHGDLNRLLFDDPALGRAVCLAVNQSAPDEMLWVACDGRVLAWSPAGVELRVDSAASAPRALLPGGSPTMLATAREGLLGLVRGEWKTIQTGQGRGGDEVNALVRHEDALYAATARGLLRIDDHGPQLVIGERFITDVVLWDGGIYASTVSGELFRVGEPLPLCRIEGSIRCLTPWVHGLLIGGDNGIHLLDAEGRLRPFALVDEARAPAENHVTALAQLGGGRVLVGGFDHGVSLLDLGGVEGAPSFSPFGPQQINGVNRIAVAAEGSYCWVAATDGAYQLDAEGQVVRRLTSEQGLIHDNVADVLISNARDGGAPSIDFATAAGLSRLDGGSIRSIYHFHGLCNNHVYSLAPYAGGVLVGTLGGLNQVRGMRVERTYRREDGGLRAAWITSLLALERGVLVGTYGGGLSLYDEQGCTPLAQEFADVEINFNALAQAGGLLLAGTLDRGLLVGKENGGWRSLTHGLPSTNVFAVLPLGQRLLLGTDAGLLLLPLRDLEREFEQ